MDNCIVTFVSTVHDKEVSIKANRKKPRITATNRANVSKVWGDDHVEEIQISEFIDDYIHAMNAVDRADQLVASLTMKHKCVRTWMPFFCYLLNIFRVNSYITHRELGGKLSHMDFTLGLVDASHSRKNDVPVSRKRALEDEPTHRSTKRKCLRNQTSPLPEERLRNPDTHKASFYEWRRKCFYCRYKAAAPRRDGNRPGKISICSRGCAACEGLCLCAHCFATYHSEDAEL